MAQAARGSTRLTPTGGRERAERTELAPDRAAVETLPGIGRATGAALRARGLRVVGDLCWLLPLAYEDERVTTPITRLVHGRRQVVAGVVVAAHARGGWRGRGVTEVTLQDEDGARARLVWFRAFAGTASRFPEGAHVRAAGTVDTERGTPSLAHPDVDVSSDGPIVAGAVTARYPEVRGVAPRVLRRAIGEALERCRSTFEDAIPDDIRAREGIGAVGDALVALHAPAPDLDDGALAAWNARRSPHHERLALEEFFVLELALHRRRALERGVRAAPLPAKPKAFARAGGALGFELTSAQASALAQIRDDLARPEPMRRLLQGDVGSGKTAVALLAAAHAIAAGAQVALMAPTEVLAEQHARTLMPIARAMGFRAGLTLGGERSAHRGRLRRELEEGRLDLVVGTHALLSEGVAFHRLGLVVVDEQHRFGVSQRLGLVDKGGAGLTPHLLVMTATPIPRSLALTLYGDLDASVIDMLPPGRLPPTTRAYRSSQRERALRQLERALEAGGQAYVVCPAIDDDEDGTRSVTSTFAELGTRFERWGVALLHGRLDTEERHAAMERFARGEVGVLVSTTVIEVGVDVPRANAVLIEHAERFGLAQLHQLRGRVGRAGQPSACLLLHDAASGEARARIEVLCDCSDGFRIAEEDLRLRGPGELFGRRQSGLPGFRFGDLRRDVPLLERARAMAATLLATDPELTRPEHRGARAALERQEVADREVVKEEAG